MFLAAVNTPSFILSLQCHSAFLPPSISFQGKLDCNLINVKTMDILILKLVQTLDVMLYLKETGYKGFQLDILCRNKTLVIFSTIHFLNLINETLRVTFENKKIPTFHRKSYCSQSIHNISNIQWNIHISVPPSSTIKYWLIQDCKLFYPLSLYYDISGYQKGQ